MIILGITGHFTSGATLMVDGRVTAAVNEKRLVRSKMVMGFPWRSIETVLQVAGVRPEEIDCVAVASSIQSVSERICTQYLHHWRAACLRTSRSTSVSISYPEGR